MPYWNGATYRAILRSLFSGQVIDGPDLGRARSLVMENLGVEEAILCGSGSLALEIVLRACGVRPGDEVVIPTFCCTSVVLPVLAVGALPVLADIGEELNVTAGTVEQALTDKTRAIIVPHLFGNPAGIDAIIDLACGRGIRVIDDAAQALGATIDGRPVGSYGDAGILSFGAEKVCFGIGGGAAVCQSREALIGSVEVDLPPAQLFPSVRSLFSTVMWRRWRRWTLPLQAAFSRADTKSPDSPLPSYRKEAMANLNAAVALSLMRSLRENIAARRARVRAYRELLEAEQRLTLIRHRPGSACLTQVVRVAPGPRDGDPAAQIIGALGRAGCEAQGSYVPIHLLPGYEQWAREALPHAERVWPDLVELPCEPEVSLDDVERMASIVKRVVNG
jgi:dTDP-4-amino-4,6-dideoxygalactose transaminase